MAAVCAFAPLCPVNQRWHKFVEIADIMSKSTSISAPKVGMDMQFLASYSSMPGPIPGACLKFVRGQICRCVCWNCGIFP